VLDNVSFTNEATNNVRTTILDVKQEFISDACDANMNKVNSFVDVSNKGLVYKMKFVLEMNVHEPNKLFLDRIKSIQMLILRMTFLKDIMLMYSQRKWIHI